MPTPRVLVLRAPGTNCDRETAFAFEQAGGQASLQHINRLLENPRLPQDFQILCIPGGFSYGDDIAAGRILANQIRHHLREAILEFQAAGKLAEAAQVIGTQPATLQLRYLQTLVEIATENNSRSIIIPVPLDLITPFMEMATARAAALPASTGTPVPTTASVPARQTV